MKTTKFNLENLRKINIKAIKFKISKPVLVLTLLLILFNVFPSFAQEAQINTKLAAWSSSIKKVLNAVVGIFSIAGGFLIFIQYMQGNEQAQKNFIRFIIGLAIFGLVALIANVFLPTPISTEP